MQTMFMYGASHVAYLIVLSFAASLLEIDGFVPSSPRGCCWSQKLDESVEMRKIEAYQERRFRTMVDVSRIEEETRATNGDAWQRSSSSPSSQSQSRGAKNGKLPSPLQIERNIISLGRKGKIDQALEIYNSLDQPLIRQMNAIIDACSRSRPVRLDLSFSILRHAPVAPNVYTFGSLMSVCARAGSAQHAIRLLRTMERDYGVEPNAVVYNTAVSACGRANPPQPDLALKLLQEARDRGLRMSVVGYNAAISAAAQAGDWPGAVSLLNQMEKQQIDVDNDHKHNLMATDDRGDSMIPRPDAVSYGTVLSAFERGRKWQRILEFAEYMQSIGQPLDGLAITSVLHACQSLGLPDEAVRYLNLMKHSTSLNQQRQTAGWQIPGGKTPLDGPDAVAYLLVVSACARGGDWIRGIELLNEYCNTPSIRDREVDVNIFTAAITGCEYAGQWEEAFLLLERMRKNSVEPNERAFAAVIGACATACAKLTSSELQKGGKRTGKHPVPMPQKKALRLLKVMSKDPNVVSPTPLVYNAAIRCMAEAHDLKRALKLYDALQADNLQPNVITFGSLMTACERTGNTDGMNTVFNLLKGQGVQANDVIYGAAISCCRKAFQGERAFLLLNKMIKEGLQPNAATVNTVLMAQAGSRSSSDLARIYKMLRPGSELSVKPNRHTFNIIIRAFAERKQAKEAETVLHHMRDSGFPPDVDLYTLVVSAYERTGQPLKALRLMESMNAEGYAFYEDKVLNAAFKRLLKMANMVGQRLSSDKQSRSMLDEDD